MKKFSFFLDILEKITGLSDTLSSVKNDSNSISEKSRNTSFPLQKVRNTHKTQMNISKKLSECSVSTRGDTSVSNLEKIKNKKKGSKIDVVVKL